MFLTIAAAILLVLGSNKYFLPSKLLWAVFLVIVVTGILFTFNRVHWAIVALIIFVFGLMRERKIVFAISIAAAVLILTVPALRERFSQLLYFSSNLSDRDIIWQGASKIYLEHPLFGFGPKNFTQIFPLFDSLNDKSVSGWHCDYLQVYMESGLMGLIPFLWLAVSVFYFSIKSLLKKNIDSFNKDLALALLLAMAGFYLTAVLGTFISDPISSLLYQLLLGILAVNYRSIKFTKQ
jgi:O-antigen ligase